MSDVKMSDVFALPVQQGEHELFLLANDCTLYAEFEKHREEEVEYSIVAINSYDSNQELISEMYSALYSISEVLSGTTEFSTCEIDVDGIKALLKKSGLNK